VSEFHEQAERLGLDGDEVLEAAEQLDDTMPQPIGPSPEEVLNGTSRAALRRASAGVIRAGRGLVVDHGMGYDPNAATESVAWWARARMTGGRAVETVTVEGHASGLLALEALAERVDRKVRKLRRQR
jgi:hypothetical protein